MNRLLAEAATSLIGTSFRLHGRIPATGLDCVGLVAEAMRRAGHEPDCPAGYSLRLTSVARWLAHADRSGLVETADRGDVILCMANPVQPHLVIAVPGGFVHAHAGIGRVTFLPAPLPWPVAQQWRLAEKDV
ncbi:peptidoglycan endopeptidase [Novosphingobium sp. MMS21-SN21R]|uniref:peptidoglycan endopeptidase n=1 Tax=Novosphingobium sp. MMS21-SN21R TaxID=2969298 RepID=UPI00288696C6|nr:peptidoglycan endopeptidase [Novosphingobium sp. MMS21-SN21R]MDT0506795.1 peptidoglycan endopeptidase [Novosphingobium sp. MMS21-SN21R]